MVTMPDKELDTVRVFVSLGIWVCETYGVHHFVDTGLPSCTLCTTDLRSVPFCTRGTYAHDPCDKVAKMACFNNAKQLELVFPN